MHERAVARAVAGVENRALVVVEAVSAHPPDDGETEPWRVLLIALAIFATWVGVVARPAEHFCNPAFEHAVVLAEQEPPFRLARRGIDLLPQAGHDRLVCRRALNC